MRLKLKVAKGSRKTGTTLGKLLEGLGHSIVTENPEAVVCYGVDYKGTLPNVNAKVFVDKFYELVTLDQADVKVPYFITDAGVLKTPFLGRKFKHSRGLDIHLIKGFDDLKVDNSDYFVEFIPSETEFRTWIFRDHHLGTYKKVKVREPDRAYRHSFGRSHRLGYAFQLVKREALRPEVVEIAKQAVKALELDFGAVDILWHPKGFPVVLEVNTAPGVEGEGRQAIRKLAENISRWLGRQAE